MDDFDRLYRKNRQRVFAYLLRLTADYLLSRDLTQESFTRCLSQVRPKRRQSRPAVHKRPQCGPGRCPQAA
jgi:DNA-directed RNA polymerase specialized sigma24 family protein